MSTFVRNIDLKKRKRVTSRGLNRRPEIKQVNNFTLNNLYTAISVTAFRLDLTRGILHPYYLFELGMPIQGTQSYQRIGNQINVKWIRLKGYIAIYDRLISNCRLKFYLVRSYGKALTGSEFLNFFNDWQTISFTDTNAWNVLTNMRHNYYKATFKPDLVGRSKGYVINKLFELKLHPSSHSMSPHVTQAYVESHGTVGGTQVTNVPEHMEVGRFDLEAVDNLPIDVKLSIQETIDCRSDHYYLYAMEDYPYASDAPKSTTGYPEPKLIDCFDANFFSRLYFTDA